MRTQLGRPSRTAARLWPGTGQRHHLRQTGEQNPCRHQGSGQLQPYPRQHCAEPAVFTIDVMPEVGRDAGLFERLATTGHLGLDLGQHRIRSQSTLLFSWHWQ